MVCDWATEVCPSAACDIVDTKQCFKLSIYFLTNARTINQLHRLSFITKGHKPSINEANPCRQLYSRKCERYHCNTWVVQLLNGQHSIWWQTFEPAMLIPSIISFYNSRYRKIDTKLFSPNDLLSSF